MSNDEMWSYALKHPFKFERIQIKKPQPSDLAEGEVLVRVLVGGICGSDIPPLKGQVTSYGSRLPEGRKNLPIGAPLHEIVGEVVASRDSSLNEGDRIVGWATSSNALSEYVIVYGGDVHGLQTDLEPSTAIILQPLACVLHAVSRIAGVEGSTVAVIGQGSIGVLFSHVLKQKGAARVIGVDRVDRSAVADVFGVDEMVWSSSDSWAAGLTDLADQVDIVVEAAGHQVSTLTDAITALRNWGQIYYFGMPDDPVYPFPMAAFLRKNATLKSGYSPLEVRRASLERAEEYFSQHPDIAKPYVTHAFNFSDVEEAFSVAATQSASRLKVTLEI